LRPAAASTSPSSSAWPRRKQSGGRNNTFFRGVPRGADGRPEADPELRDTENILLKESIYDYFEREVPPRSLDEGEANIKSLAVEIPGMVRETVG
jgi:hypothetical protein